MHTPLKSSWIDTPLGPMLALGDETALFFLGFKDQRGLERGVERIRRETGAPVIPGRTGSIEQIERELARYFAGELVAFQTPLRPIGSPFQKRVWGELTKIPNSQTRSYAELAALIDKPTAYRAVAQANGANPFAIIVPCHRVVSSGGGLGGYSGGLERKQWLLGHERAFCKQR